MIMHRTDREGAEYISVYDVDAQTYKAQIWQAESQDKVASSLRFMVPLMWINAAALWGLFIVHTVRG